MVAHLRDISGNPVQAVHGPNRVGDIPHSLADISKANNLLGYQPRVLFYEGLENTWNWWNGFPGD
jgi:UDP-N-acetylglucosamine 4-epimerase